VHRRVVADHQRRRALLRIGLRRAHSEVEFTSPPPQPVPGDTRPG
jgi:hypothetical protein